MVNLTVLNVFADERGDFGNPVGIVDDSKGKSINLLVNRLLLDQVLVR